jgi:putative alpha-1,2-mannosidase
MGLYALAPGTPDYVLGSPLFAAMSIALPGGGALQILAPNNTADTVYVQSVTWNGAAVSGVSLPYGQLMQGGTLTFQVGAQPPAGAQSGAQCAGHAGLRGSGRSKPRGA